MPRSTRRRITMLDALVLAAATAASLAPIRAVVLLWNTRWQAISKGALGTADVYIYIHYGSLLLAPLLFLWSVADLALCLRRPRPSLRRLARQPGAVAALVASLWGTLIIALMVAKAAFARIGAPNVPHYLETTFSGMQSWVGPAVSGAWLALALCGRRRPEPTWIDRLGRGLGAGWIAILLLLWISNVLMYVRF